MSDKKQLRHVVRFMDGVSFTVEFDYGADTARITDITGWVDEELETNAGTYKAMHAEAERIIVRAVETGRCSKYANRSAGGELKRNLYAARRLAKMGPSHPLRKHFTSGG